jgi:hypothetical protein
MPERIAYVCPHKDHEASGYAYRVFLFEDDPAPPTCPTHPRSGPMKLQSNKPYHTDSAARYAAPRENR